MESFEYYKSLITDEEVIAALTRESQAREGTLEKPRVRPNLNFLQRTVSNMVSSNNRLTTKQKEMIVKEREKNSSYRPRKAPVRKKLHIDIIQDILSKQIDFVKSSDTQERGTKCISHCSRNIFGPLNRSESSKEQSEKKSIAKHKSQLEVVREILIGRIDSLKASKESCNPSDSQKDTKKDLASTKKKEICQSSNDEVIILDDSDSTSSSSDSKYPKNDYKNVSPKRKKEHVSDSSDSETHKSKTRDCSRRKKKKIVTSDKDIGSLRNIKNQISEVIHVLSDSE